jgi:lambda repressor-like predicted transcriptional regulator
MESTLEVNSIALEKSSFLPKIAILIYWAAALQFLYSAFFPRKVVRSSISTHTMLPTWLLGLLVFFLAYGVLKLFLAYKMSRRKNWARIVVVIIAAAQGVFLIPGAIAMAQLSQQALVTLLTHSWGGYAEIVAAVLLLLPQSWDWFAPRRASN